MTTQIPESALPLLDQPEFATLATVLPDGQPHLSVVWVAREGNDLLMSTVVGRQKHRNLVANPRATVLVYPKSNPYSYVEVRGQVTMTESDGRDLIDRLNKEYTGGDRYIGDDGTDNVRVILRLTPDKVITR